MDLKYQYKYINIRSQNKTIIYGLRRINGFGFNIAIMSLAFVNLCLFLGPATPINLTMALFLFILSIAENRVNVFNLMDLDKPISRYKEGDIMPLYGQPHLIVSISKKRLSRFQYEYEMDLMLLDEEKGNPTVKVEAIV